MKLLKTLAIVAVLASSLNASAQKNKPFEGMVVYTLNFDDAGLDPASASMMAGKEMVVFLKDSKSRTEIDMGMVKTITIADVKDKSNVTLMDLMGQKMAIKATKEEIEKHQAAQKKPQITYLEDTKEIAGYKCKKAQLKFDDSEDITTIYYTTDISMSANDMIPGLQGFPMEYEMDMNGVKALAIVKTIKAEKVADTQFITPEGYQVVTPEELQKMFGGGGEK